MEKIIIKNFGPIEEAEIEIRKVLVLIGEQASGKSTIAKLIYFFKTLGEEIFSYFIDADSPAPEIGVILELINRRFYDFYGSTRHFLPFDIRFEYDPEVNITISNTAKNNNLEIRFSKRLMDKVFYQSVVRKKIEIQELRADLKNVRSNLSKKTMENELNALYRALFTMIAGAFKHDFDSSLYIPAGRESTVSYPTVFRAYMQGKLNDEIEKLRKGNGQLIGQASDEILMLAFLEEIDKITGIFNKGRDFEGIREFLNISTESAFISDPEFQSLISRISKILKGKYGIDDRGEFLIVNDQGLRVYVKDASSGQKEALRVLQDLFLSAMQGLKTFRVIEEPEAHLFPSAQKQLIELLVFLANAQAESQVIITTHSPYVLTAVNNMLVAQKVADQFPEKEEEIAGIYPQKFRIRGDQFAAYSLGNSMMEDAPFCASLVNEKTGLIAQNYLDTVSLSLGHEFQQMMQFYRNARINHDA